MSSSHFSSHPEIEGLTLFKASPGPHLHEVHEHEAYSVIMLTSGQKVFHHMGTSQTVKAGEIAVANPGQMHGCGPIDEKNWAHRTWYISQHLMHEIAKGLKINSPIELEFPVIRNKALFKKLIQAHKNSTQGDLLERQDAALEYLTTLIKHHANTAKPASTSSTNGSENRFKIYTEYLQENLDQPVELKDLAACTRVQRNQVIKDFRHVTGVTPGKVFKQMRLDSAKTLLSEDVSLADIATTVGFSDQSHLTRSFRKAYGITPKKFRILAQESGGTVPL